jgi:hypothetical protein
MEFEHREIENVPDVAPIKTTAKLLSAARREFLNRKTYDGPQMTALTRLFDAIAQEAYQARFYWGEYNRGQWDRFINLHVGNEGGACAFSFEDDGSCPTQKVEQTKGMFLGVPVGFFPFQIGPLGLASREEAVVRTITQAGYIRSE